MVKPRRPQGNPADALPSSTWEARRIRKYLLALAIVLVIDLAWLLVLMRSFYAQQLGGFSRPEVVPIWSAIAAWALIPLGIVLFVDIAAKSVRQTAAYGAIYGLILYGVYGFTNYAILADWTGYLLLVDVIWGMALCSTSSVLVRLISSGWKG